MVDQTRVNSMTVNDYIDANLVHSIHVSERRSFRGCRRRWNWVYRDMWYPQTTAKPLAFGVAYHKAAEHWYDPDFWNVVPDKVRQEETLAVFRQACKEQKDSYKQKVRNGLIQSFMTDEEIEQDYKERVTLGEGMLRQMFKQSAELDHEYFRPVGVEVKFEVPILLDGNTIWCKCQRCYKKAEASTLFSLWFLSKPIDELVAETHVQALKHWPLESIKAWYYDVYWQGLPVTYGGRIDMLAQDIYGRYWIFDWKTAARLSTGEPGSPDDFLWLDDQVTSYCWALSTLGMDIAGFVYHEQKKSIPEEPEPLKRPYKGALYSQNRQKDFDYAVYRKTVEENDPQGYLAGVYDEFLEYLRTEGGVYYKRHQIHRNSHELLECGRNIALEAADMVDPSLRLYPSPGRFACNGCAFREPCLGQSRGEDYEYTLASLFEKRQRLYYEDAPSNTDKPQRV